MTNGPSDYDAGDDDGDDDDDDDPYWSMYPNGILCTSARKYHNRDYFKVKVYYVGTSWTLRGYL